MSLQEFERKLTAILSADIAGYSRLMGKDEDFTIKTLTGHREMMTTLIRKHKGRVIDSPGDNLLAVFSSVTRAVDCAVEIQREMAERNEELPDNRKMEYRIGVNLGDVIEEGDRIYGDGVNIAARLESLAEPGGICISDFVYKQVRNRLKLEYEFMGDQSVKNIKEPVPVYRVLMGSETTAKVVEKEKTKGGIPPRIGIAVAILILLCIATGLFYWKFYSIDSSKIEERSIETEQTPVKPTVEEAPKTIAVLPFENLSSEKDQEYFADGITEELLNSLSRISGLEVRGRTSSFYFKGKDMDLPTISKILNVDNILEGSVRKAGEQVRITVQLINTRKDAHLWSKTYERTINDIFAIQDDIAKSVADALQITLRVGELGRSPGMTNNMDAYDAYLDGRSLMSKYGREDISQAIEQMKQAVAIDPDFANGWRALAGAYANARYVIPERSEEWEAKLEEASSRADKLFLERFPDSNLALTIAASQSGDRMEVERLYNKALVVAPKNDDTNNAYGWFLNTVGRPNEGIDYFKRMVRLEPLAAWAYSQLGFTYDLIGNLDAAAMTFKKAKELTSDPTFFYTGLMVLAMEEKNRALTDKYLLLSGDKVMHTLLDKPEEAVAELRLLLTDPAYKNPTRREPIAVWASYYGEYELALQIFRDLPSGFSSSVWRPIHKGMRRLPGFKEYVKEIGLVDYWRKSGNWGDFCRPVGDDDFECE